MPPEPFDGFTMGKTKAVFPSGRETAKSEYCLLDCAPSPRVYKNELDFTIQAKALNRLKSEIAFMTTTAVLRKGERTRQIFIEAASRVFVRDGYLNAEISEIAKEAGKSNGTFYIYFENKSALLDAMIEAFEDDVLERFQEHDEPWYGASQAGDWAMIVSNMWKSFTRHAATFQALSQACLVDPHFGDAYNRIRERTRNDFINFLKARQKLGFCRAINIQYVATALETMILYCLIEWLAEGGRCHDRREEKKALAALTGIFTAVMSIS